MTSPGEAPARWREQAAMLRNRLVKRQRVHERWARREGLDCFRLYDRDIPELPFAIDRYGDHLHAAAFAREGDEDPSWARFVLLEAACGLSVLPEQVALKLRRRQKGARQYERQGQRGDRLVVEERGHRFLVNLWDYLDTGLFLDHRETRARVAREAAGRCCLNLFAYTGSFGVYAAKAGAASVTQVDLSRNYLDWAKENLALNGLLSPACRFHQADTFAFLEAEAAGSARYDLVVVDPPTFSNSKRIDGTFDVRRDHVALLQAIERVLAPGGVVWFSTNARHFRLEEGALGWACAKDETEATRARDFEGRHSHRAWRLTRA